MNFRRGVGISFLAHASLLVWAHLSGAGAEPSTPRHFEQLDEFRRVALKRVRPSAGSGESGESDEASGAEPEIEGGSKQAVDDSTSDEVEAKNESPESSSDDRDSSREREQPEEKVAETDEPDETPREDESVATKKTDKPAPSENTEPESTSGSDETDPSEKSESDKMAARETGAGDDSDATGSETPGAGEAGADGTGGEAPGNGEGRDGTGDGREGIDRGKLLRGYASSIYDMIARHRSYPTAARRARLEGTVRLEIKIDASGRILAIRVHESSGHKILDEAALEVLESVDKLPSPPEALAWKTKRLRIPIRYELDGRG